MSDVTDSSDGEAVYVPKGGSTSGSGGGLGEREKYMSATDLIADVGDVTSGEGVTNVEVEGVANEAETIEYDAVELEGMDESTLRSAVASLTHVVSVQRAVLAEKDQIIEDLEDEVRALFDSHQKTQAEKYETIARIREDAAAEAAEAAETIRLLQSRRGVGESGDGGEGRSGGGEKGVGEGGRGRKTHQGSKEEGKQRVKKRKRKRKKAKGDGGGGKGGEGDEGGEGGEGGEEGGEGREGKKHHGKRKKKLVAKRIRKVRVKIKSSKEASKEASKASKTSKDGSQKEGEGGEGEKGKASWTEDSADGSDASDGGSASSSVPSFAEASPQHKKKVRERRKREQEDKGSAYSASSSTSAESESASSEYEYESTGSCEETFPQESNIFLLSQDYIFRKRVYTGDDTVLYLASPRERPETRLVIKVFDDDDYSSKRQPKSVDILGHLGRHPTIVEVISWYKLPATGCYAIVVPFIQDTPVDGKSSSSVIKKYMFDLLRALAHCHARGIVYRDCKPENIMFDAKSKTAILIDYDCATRFNVRKPPTSYTGTEGYMAPEVASRRRRKKGYGFPVDIYSAGVIFFELLFKVPADIRGDLSHSRIMRQVESISKSLRSKPAFKLLDAMLDPSPNSRITAADALVHKYFGSMLRKAESKERKAAAAAAASAADGGDDIDDAEVSRKSKRCKVQ